MDFSIILQSPEVRAIVQENTLERAMHDAIFPKLLFRSEATPEVFPGGIGDTLLMSAPGLLKPKMKPSAPGVDPIPQKLTYEQWETTLNQYDGTIDTHMPTSTVAAVDMFLRNAQQLGLQAAQTLNRAVRDRMYNSALSGHTVADAAAIATATTVAVRRLNGFTRARRPDLVSGSQVRFQAISATNTLKGSIVLDNGTLHAVEFTAYVPTFVGDEIGPGTLTFTPAIPGGRSVPDRAAVLAYDRTSMVRVGGGNSVDSVGPNDILKLSDIRSAVARFRVQSVPEFEDGLFRCHMDSVSEGQVFSDPEWQRLQTSLPEHSQYKDFAMGVSLGTIFIRDAETPYSGAGNVETGNGGDGVTYTDNDPFAGELYAGEVPGTSTPVHRPLFVAQNAIFEYYLELMQLITDAGIQGKAGTARITNNGIQVMAERIQILIREPQNRTQDQVATTYKFIGDWPVRTDSAVGDVARYKRLACIEHGE